MKNKTRIVQDKRIEFEPGLGAAAIIQRVNVLVFPKSPRSIINKYIKAGFFPLSWLSVQPS